MSASVGSQEARSAVLGGRRVTLPYGSRRPVILALLEERFPDKKIPRGALAKLTGDWSYPYAYQVAQAAGYRANSRSGPIGTVRKNVLEEVSRRYPCQEVPHGVQVTLAEKYGVTPQRISQILRNNGWKVKYSPAKEHVCRDCSGPVGEGKQVCDSCLWVPIICPSCGNEYHTTRWDLLARAKQHEKHGENRGRSMNGGYLFCKKTCRKDRAIEYMRAHPDSGWRDVAKEFGVSEGAVRGWRKSMVKPQQD